MIYYRNSDPNKNVGKTSGKRFVVFFIGKSSYFAYEDGTTELAKEDSGRDREIFEVGVLSGELEKYEVMNKILFYRANEFPYGVFSNFDTKHPINMQGTMWESTEHYFQAMKFKDTDPNHMWAIHSAPKPRDAAAMGRDRNHKLREDWEQVKDDVMREAVRAKFTQYPELGNILIDTENDELIEHTSNDHYWADGGDGTGKNMLGKILMEIREELKLFRST